MTPDESIFSNDRYIYQGKSQDEKWWFVDATGYLAQLQLVQTKERSRYIKLDVLLIPGLDQSLLNVDQRIWSWPRGHTLARHVMIYLTSNIPQDKRKNKWKWENNDGSLLLARWSPSSKKVNNRNMRSIMQYTLLNFFTGPRKSFRRAY